MSPIISFLIPTRFRKVRAERFLDSLIENTFNLNMLEVLFYVDDDDLDSREIDARGIDVRFFIGPKRTMGGFNTYLLEKSRGEIIILGNDDILIRTKNWDKYIIDIHKKIDDKIYLVYPNDLVNGEKFSTFPIMSKIACKIMSRPFPVEYNHSFIDVHLFDVFKRLQKSGYARIIYLENVIFEHMHFHVGKSEFDKVYASRELAKFQDDAIFINNQLLRKKTFDRLVKYINTSLCEYDNVSTNSKVKYASGLIYNFFELEEDKKTCKMVNILCDTQLPLSWRWRLFSWLFIRKIINVFKPPIWISPLKHRILNLIKSFFAH